MVLAVEIGNGTPTVAFAASGWIFQNGQIRHLRRLESVASVDGRRARGACFRCRPLRSVRPRRAVQSAWAGPVMRLSGGQAKEMMRSADVLWVQGWRTGRPWIWCETFVVHQLSTQVSTSHKRVQSAKAPYLSSPCALGSSSGSVLSRSPPPGTAACRKTGPSRSCNSAGVVDRRRRREGFLPMLAVPTVEVQAVPGGRPGPGCVGKCVVPCQLR
jgi:hypothetical protein